MVEHPDFMKARQNPAVQYAAPKPVQWRDRIPFLLGAILAIGLAAFESQTAGDAEIFLSASSDLFHGVNPYAQRYHTWYHYYYDLLFLWIIHPLTWLPARLAKFIWILVLELAMFRTWHLVEQRMPPLSSTRSVWKERGILLAVSINLWVVNFHLQQITPLLLWALLEATHSRSKPWKSLFVGLGMASKVMPIAALPLWFLRKDWSKMTMALTGCLLALFLPAMWLGVSENSELMQSRWELLNPTNQEHTIDVDEESFHSVTTLIPTLTYAEARGTNTREWRRHIVDWPLPVVRHLTRAVQLALILLVLAFLTSRPWTSPVDAPYEWAALFLIIPLVFPHQQIYSFLLAFPALAWMIRTLWFTTNTASPRWIRVVFVLSALMLNLHFYVGAWRPYLNHYKVLTWGGLLLACCLWASKPKVQTLPST